MVVAKGFKQTEVGVIPEDWEVYQIKELLSNNWLHEHMDGNHGELYPRSEEFTESGVPYIGATDFSDGKIDFNNCKYLPLERASKFKKGIAKNGDVLFAHNATVGPVAILRTDENYVILSTTATYFRCNGLHLINDYFLYALVTDAFVKQYKAVMAQSTRFQVPITTQRKFRVVIPSLVEQTAIATALSDTDALLTALDRLIAKQRNIKQGAMQRLLSGKERLPGFEGEWVETELGKVLTGWSSGATPYRGRPEFYKGNIRWITSGELNYKVIYDTIEKISEEAVKATNLKLIPKGTLLIAITGLEAAGTRGSCAIVGAESTTNQSCMALFPSSELSTEFLFHYYVHNGDELAFKYCQGTKQQSYTGKIIKILPIKMPPTLAEQTAIATVLSDMDAEIAALEAKRAKLQGVKQGMMQELLTGKIRLI